jgi:hypothetical protein
MNNEFYDNLVQVDLSIDRLLALGYYELAQASVNYRDLLLKAIY